MTEERRYQDDEVKAIFAAAAEAPEPMSRAVDAGAGLTLPALQEIGREVGIAPERIAAAARDLDRPVAIAPRRSYLGLPFAVSRSVDLPRAPTDREWALLVAELRETFAARGKVESAGELREWRNGNLHVSIAPTETGYRLRLRTRKGSPASTVGLGLAGVVAGIMMVLTLLVPGAVGFSTPLLLFACILAISASGIFQLPAWAREREEQMEYIAERAQQLLGSGATEPA